MTTYPIQPEPLKKKPTSPWVWVGCGCGALTVGILGFIAFIVFVVFAAIRSAEPYRDGVARAKADPRVIEVLGAPVEAGWYVSGSIRTQNRDGNCDISVPLNGSKQSGSLRVVGTKEDGRWTYTRMTVTPEAGPPVDLLPAESTSTAPPAG
jgi:Cytochrome oxidase complex assembly protein 1